MNYLQQVSVSNLADENTSFLDKVGYAAVGAVTSGAIGFWNTGIALANTVRSDESQIAPADIGANIGRLMGTQAKSYYDDNSEWIDVAGFVGSSFVPGGLAVSGVRALRAGKVVKSFANLGMENGIAGKFVGQATAIARADPKGTMAGISSLRWKAIAGAGGDALVDNTVASIAILGALNQNPLLNKDGDLSYFDSFAHNFSEFVNPLSGGLAFGIFAGDVAFRSVAAWGQINKRVGAVEMLRRIDQAIQDPGQLNILRGDKALVYADTAELRALQIKESQGIFGPTRNDANIDTRVKDWKQSQQDADLAFNGMVAEMIGGPDPDLKQLMDKAGAGKDIEGLSQIYSGTTNIRRLQGEDIMGASTGKLVPTVEALDDFEFAARLSGGENIAGTRGAWSSQGFGDPMSGDLPLPGIIVRKAEFLEGTYGVSGLEAQHLVFLHELGHNRSDFLAKALQQNGMPMLNPDLIRAAIANRTEMAARSKLAGTPTRGEDQIIPGLSNKNLLAISDEMVQLSRLRRSSDWTVLDTLKGELDQLRANKADVARQLVLEKDIRKVERYLYKPEELMADAYAVLATEGIRGHQIAAMAPKTYGLFKKQRVMFEQLTARKVIYDSVTGDFIKGKTLGQVGDFGDVKLSSRGDAILFGENQSVPVTKWDPTKMTVREADAQWAAWELMGRETRFANMFEELDGDNLPQVQAWLNKMEREHGVDAENVFSAIRISGDDEAYERSFGEIKRHLQDTKADLLRQQKELLGDTKITGGPEDNVQGLARKYNVNDEFVYWGPDHEKAMGAIYANFDPTKPRHAVLVAHKTVPFDDVKARSFVNLKNRIQLAGDQAKSVAAQVLGQQADTILSLTNKDALNELGTTLDVSSVSSTRGLFSAMNAAIGSFQSKAQAVGKQLQKVIGDRHRAIEKDMGDSFYPVVNNKAALIEVNTLIATEFRGANKWTHFGNLTEEEQDIARLMLPASGEQAMINREAINEAMEMAWGRAGKQGAEKAPAMDFQAVADRVKQKYADKLNLALNSAEASKALQWLETYSRDMTKHTLQLANAAGKTMKWDLDHLYVPPPNVAHYTHVAFVSQKVPDGILAGNERGVIIASSGDELAKKMALYKETYGEDGITVATKDEVIAYKKAQSEYDASQMVKERSFDSQLRRTGALQTNLVRSDNLELEHIQDWMKNLAGQNVRNATGLAFAQEIAELRHMSNLYGSASSSKWQGLNRAFRSEGADPWQQTIDILLNKNQYGKQAPIWKALSETLDSGFTAVLAPVYAAFKKSPSLAELELVNREMISRGYTPPYQTVADLALANSRAPTQLLSSLVTKSNAVTSFFLLGADTLHAITNAISLPVLLIPELVASKKLLSDPEFMMKFGVVSPDGVVYPTSGKAISKAIGALFTDKAAMERYRAQGFIGDEVSVMRQALGDLELPSGAFGPPDSSIWKIMDEKASRAAAITRTISGVDYAENAVRFIAANVAEQMADAAKITNPGERLSLVNTIINRVHGNYTSAQRPLMFQGVVGQAIGLFQTYQFNVMQQIFRNWGEGNKKALAIMGGIQASLFGVRGIPGYDVLSTHAIGEHNPDNHDLTSFLYSSFGDSRDPILNRRLADWFVYGLPSNFFHLDIYSRGDLNPRTPTLIPTSISEIPAYSVGTRFFQNVARMAGAASASGLNGNVLLEGLAHNALNRPLAGIATQMLGYRTTTQGNKLLFAQDEENKILAWSAALVGGKPIDEAIALDTLYRKVSYDSARTEELSSLAAGYRASIRAGEIPDTVELLQKYQQKGGRIETYNKWFQNTIQGANESQLKKIVDDSNTPAARNARAIIGTDRSLSVYRPMEMSEEEDQEDQGV